MLMPKMTLLKRTLLCQGTLRKIAARKMATRRATRPQTVHATVRNMPVRVGQRGMLAVLPLRLLRGVRSASDWKALPHLPPHGQIGLACVLLKAP